MTWLYGIPVWVIAPLAVIIATGLSLVGLHLARTLIKRSQLIPHNDVAGAIFGTIGTVLAVGLSFMFINVWTQYVVAAATVQQEANSLADLHHLANAFPQPAGARIQNELDQYMQLVIRVEWPLMRTGDRSNAAYHAGYAVLNTITSFHPKTSEDVMLQSHALDSANAFLDYRRQRLHANDDGIPGLVWAALIFVGCIVVIFSFYFRVDNAFEQRLMVAALASVIAVVMLLIAEFDYPFRGDIAVKPTALQHAWDSIHNAEGGY